MNGDTGSWEKSATAHAWLSSDAIDGRWDGPTWTLAPSAAYPAFIHGDLDGGGGAELLFSAQDGLRVFRGEEGRPRWGEPWRYLPRDEAASDCRDLSRDRGRPLRLVRHQLGPSRG